MTDDTSGTDALVDELAGAAGVSDTDSDAIGSAAPDTATPTDTDPQPSDAKSVSSTPDASAEGDPAAPPVPEVDPEKYLALEGASPFTFRVDGRSVAPEGALLVGDRGVYFPRDTWDRQMHGLLADRGTIKQREAEYRQRIQQAESGRAEWEAEKAAYTEELFKMFGDWENIAAAKERWDVEGPRRVAELQARAATRQLAQMKEQQAAQAREAEQAALIPRLEQHLSDTVGEWMGEAGVHPDSEGKYPEEWVRWWVDLMEDHGVRGLYQRGPGGDVELNQDKAYRLFQRQLSRAKANGATKKEVAKVQARNTAAVAPSKAKPPGPGKPAATSRNPAAAAASSKNTAPFDPQNWLAKRNYFDEE